MANRFFPRCEGYKITSRFGMRNHPVTGVYKMHNGIDLVGRTSKGTSCTDYITAHTGGIVYSVGCGKSSGNFVKIRTADDVIMVYYHLKDYPTLSQGDKVDTGEIIGYMGHTGTATGDHLHFGIQVGGVWVDPEPFLNCDYTPGGAAAEKKEEKTVDISIKVLKKGSKGETVEALQALLLGLGYDLGTTGPKKNGVDGSFGGKTENALMCYQEDNGLAVDGSCGRKTWTKILGL